MTFINSETTRKAYLGKAAQSLILTSSDQVREIYELRGLVIPVRVSSTLEIINRKPGISLSEIGRALGIPHQLVAQRTGILLKMSLIEKRPDKKDRRFLDRRRPVPSGPAYTMHGRYLRCLCGSL